MICVLLVEDDSCVAEIIQYYLQTDGQYKVTRATTGGEAFALAWTEFDVILLDILLPDVNGVLLCGQLRKYYKCPIIFISCIDDRDMIVHALESGGDDFIVKPFDNKILEARIRANLRRVAMDSECSSNTRLTVNDFSADLRSQKFFVGGKAIELSPIEFRIVTLLMQNPGKYFTAEKLYSRIWGQDSYGDVRTVQVHIHSIRKKIENNPNTPYYIKNIRGKGYYLDNYES